MTLITLHSSADKLPHHRGSSSQPYM